MRLVFRFVSMLLGAGWVAFVLATPLLGVWLASSIIAFNDGPRMLAIFGGVLLFPVLPLAWELRASSQWKAKLASRKQLAGQPKRKLGAADRLILRTLFVNLVFIGVLLVWFPKVAFTALATRGDWFLAEHHEPWSRDARKVLFAAASSLEWLHELANPNPWKKQGDDVPVPSSVTPIAEDKHPVADAGVAVAVRPDVPDAGSVPVVVRPPKPPVNPDAAWTVGDTTWPWLPRVHPVVAAMTASDETSIEAVAKHIAEREKEPFARVKALHDWVVTRLQYDEASLDPAHRKPQDAQSVFANRVGVCEGYARLMVELGKFSGDPIAFVVGDVREENGAIAAVGHAWNAVEIDGKWYLVDATWDDPIIHGAPGDPYQTDYLFIPPSVAIFDHLPEDSRWQLLPKPLSRGDFLRQPFARPGLAREGLALLNPDRASVEVRDALDLALDNPRGLFVSAQLTPERGGAQTDCGVDSAAKVKLRCPVASPGHYVARLFTNRQRFGTFTSIASIDVLAK